MNLDKARILVTGGSSGLGKAMAAALIAKGAHVAITGRDPDKLQRVAEELGATRSWLASRAVTIYGGTNEVQANIIAKRVLGLPD